ncbi:alpha/beta fold hydrolase [Solimonas sp. SE-A11]|uniref:alpha/beta fold hydrolase n=1 Tax=Solimonas sp. SE-A11 TaxID=3054954 RepID=UPI00259CFBF6|nr:alpha/beta hydrolase [Solimonas sp. SE-A11]MDM4772535.1 alpha/beta hydrolase [Solimonas sp. SE-A11]
MKLSYSDSTELDIRSLGVAAVICVVLLPLATMIAVAHVLLGQTAAPTAVRVGQSYGGLIGALHAAQAPALVKLIVQIDPTPEFDHELIDSSLWNIPVLARFLELCTLLSIDNPLMSLLSREPPPDIVTRLKSTPRQMLRSLQGSIAEICLLQ